MEKLGINLTLLIAQIVNVAVLMLLLRSVAYKPILKFLDGRREKIAKGLEDARKAEARLANIEADYSKRMDEARAEGQKTVAEMRRMPKNRRPRSLPEPMKTRLALRCKRRKRPAGTQQGAGRFAFTGGGAVDGCRQQACRRVDGRESPAGAG